MGARALKALVCVVLPVLAGGLASPAALAQEPAGMGGWGQTVVTGAAPQTAPAAPKPRKSPKATAAAPGRTQAGNTVTAAAVSGSRERTRLTFDLARPVQFTAFRLSRPERIVIDLAEVDFMLAAGTGERGGGLVKAFRYGLFSPGKSRIVVDTEGPTRIDAMRTAAGAGGPGSRIEIDLVPTSASELAASELAAAIQSLDLKPGLEPQAPVSEPAPRARARPVVVIDPGHGGIDPGANGSRGIEKDVVLAVGREIRRALLATRRYEIVMTRTSDVFVPLEQRVRLSQQHNADLFLSIHADSIAERSFVRAVRGATVYTLADKATDDQTRIKAEKENASDLLAGLSVGQDEADGQVRSILFDLMRRESSNFSNEFRSVLVGHLKRRATLSRDPQRSGPFKVLRQPGSPAVLVELGYISNPEDEELMLSPQWHKGVADAVSAAVDEHFRRRLARSN